jgi:hypothetical protein
LSILARPARGRSSSNAAGEKRRAAEFRKFVIWLRVIRKASRVSGQDYSISTKSGNSIASAAGGGQGCTGLTRAEALTTPNWRKIEPHTAISRKQRCAYERTLIGWKRITDASDLDSRCRFEPTIKEAEL